jgi:moderate conductance mechanosensitive channel
VIPHAVALALVATPVGTGRSATGLTLACGRAPGIACRLTWDLTHSTRAAELIKVYFAGPVSFALRVGFVILLALIVRAAAHRVIRRITARATAEYGASDRAHPLFRERRRQRASALGSILRNAASVTIFTIAAVIIVGDMGLNLAPVLASAGVLGVALAFGAQNLVQDFLAGIFMLLEDQYGVGDVIDVSGITGTVEAVSLRITSIRDVNGVVWHIRNGTIKRAGNESQGWARAVIDFPVGHDQDIARVREVMHAAAAAMWQEPEWREAMLEEPEVWGVQAVSSDAVVIRLVAKTASPSQWDVARELRGRLKIALDLSLIDTDPEEPAAEPGQAKPGQVKPGQAKPGPAAPATQ